MGAGARRMCGWAVEDAPVRAPDGEGVGGNAAQNSQSWGEDRSNWNSGTGSGAARSKAED
jgi:hypothetical protein